MKKGRRFLQIIFIIITVLWAGFIFYNSIMDVVQTNEISNSYTEQVNETIEQSGYEVSNIDMRKFAHFFEFSVLAALLLIGSAVSVKKMSVSEIFMVFFLGLMAAASDETIQIFSDGRDPRVQDIWIDFGGVLFGMAVIFAARYLIKKISKYI
ncbi:MAG: VanZ family protein [Firmicutes bacterium]|nr:VanZ family protein [Bacillota bacterium]